MTKTLIVILGALALGGGCDEVQNINRNTGDAGADMGSDLGGVADLAGNVGDLGDLGDSVGADMRWSNCAASQPKEGTYCADVGTTCMYLPNTVCVCTQEGQSTVWRCMP